LLQINLEHPVTFAVSNFKSQGMKNELLHNWNFMRFVRLVLGIAIVVQAVIAKDWTMGILGTLFTCMPVFNIGCCSVGGCSSPVNKKEQTTKDITYEEVV
jgi:hypothetical protein